MIVRLYVEANEKGGFSVNGPLPRFVASVCGFLGVDPPTDEASQDAQDHQANREKDRRGALASL